MISMPDRVRSVYRTEMTAAHGTDDDALRPQIRARSQLPPTPMRINQALPRHRWDASSRLHTCRQEDGYYIA